MDGGWEGIIHQNAEASDNVCDQYGQLYSKNRVTKIKLNFFSLNKIKRIAIFFRAAFKFGRRVHCALRRKITKTADYSCTRDFKMD